MRFDGLSKSFRLVISTVLLSSMLTNVATAQRNSPVLNKPFKSSSGPEKPDPDAGSWVWRARRLQKPVPGPGFEGIVAFIEAKDPSDKKNEQSKARIWLYKADPSPGDDPKKYKLKLSEKYTFYLTESEEVNTNKADPNKKPERAYSFKVSFPLRDSEGIDVPGNPGTRTFLITGTPARGNNSPRSLRITTFTTKPEDTVDAATLRSKGIRSSDDFAIKTNLLSGSEMALATDVDLSLRFATFCCALVAPCSDYPDDAVLEEEQYSATSQFPADANPDPNHPWMTYSLP